MSLCTRTSDPLVTCPLFLSWLRKQLSPQLLVHCSAEHAPLATCQSSYRQYHSTETALVKVQNDILLAMDRQEVTLLVLLDLSAAFDTIDHMILVDLPQRDLGVDDFALSWLKSCMSGRKQRVIIDQQQSRDFDLATGVPQGSCLGQILFIIYAWRLFHVMKKHLPTMLRYADDTHVCFFAGSDASRMLLSAQWRTASATFVEG